MHLPVTGMGEVYIISGGKFRKTLAGQQKVGCHNIEMSTIMPTKIYFVNLSPNICQIIIDCVNLFSDHEYKQC